MRRRALTILTTLALILGLAGTATGCATQPVTYPTPTVWTVTYQGAQYCGYEYSPYEIDMYGVPQTCRRVLFPNTAVHVAAGTLAAALLIYLETYDGFYHSGYWYDQYYAPIGPRYHVTVIQRTTFVTASRTFEEHYASDIKTRSAKATWKGAKTGQYKFPTSNAGAKKTKPLTNNGGPTTQGCGGATHDEHTAPKTPTKGECGGATHDEHTTHTTHTAPKPRTKGKPGTSRTGGGGRRR